AVVANASGHRARGLAQAAGALVVAARFARPRLGEVEMGRAEQRHGADDGPPHRAEDPLAFFERARGEIDLVDVGLEAAAPRARQPLEQGVAVVVEQADGAFVTATAGVAIAIELLALTEVGEDRPFVAVVANLALDAKRALESGAGGAHVALGERDDPELGDHVALVAAIAELDEDGDRLLEATARAGVVAAVVLEAAEVSEGERHRRGIAVTPQDRERRVVGVAGIAGVAL